MESNGKKIEIDVRLDRKTIEKLKKDVEYRIGVMAVHRFGRGRLLNWSGRYFKG